MSSRESQSCMNSCCEDTDCRITAMNAVNAVQLFILVCTFTAVCQADDGTCSVTCDDVIGSVGKEVNLTCSVSQQCIKCCIKMFKYTEIYIDSDICKQVVPEGSCEQRSSLTCRYTPTTALTAKFKFFLQPTCAAKTTEFTVNITEEGINNNPSEVSAPDTEAGLGAKVSAIAAVVGCFILIIIITMTVIRNKKPNLNRSCGFQKRMFLCIKHDEDNSDHTEDVI
ncbi:uncharacterized protein LOC131551255 isoform X2 [Onychostoma macrolepis]|uniref:uncharacterized protein LOC131551255 isoform X2 n=1 Tax=Onychostoma macrolepis TaxID=369639 RepID=UPI00272B1115|nr:uncharacterized protein LOC131551255 isoform X2 [Onychostoma macrolepis]